MMCLNSPSFSLLLDVYLLPFPMFFPLIQCTSNRRQNVCTYLVQSLISESTRLYMFVAFIFQLVFIFNQNIKIGEVIKICSYTVWTPLVNGQLYYLSHAKRKKMFYLFSFGMVHTSFNASSWIVALPSVLFSWPWCPVFKTSKVWYSIMLAAKHP